MRSVKLALLTGLALLALATGLTLTGSPATVAAGNRASGGGVQPIGTTTHGATYCQAHEVLPRGTSAIRVWLDAAAGPRVRVTVSSAGRTIASGTRGSNWIGGSVTVPVRPLPHRVADATLCVSFALQDETIVPQGMPAPAALAAHDGRQALAGRMIVEYLRSGERSWLSLAGEVARRMGLGRVAAGTWVVLVALALLCAAIALASRLLLRELA